MRNRIAIVGEAWGADEDRLRTHFVGWMSRFLNDMLEDAGISRAECLLTNVFCIRYDGRTEIFCGPKETAIAGYGPLTKGYVQAKFIPELERLRDEIMEADPNVIVAMGNAALWAFSGHAGIAKYRGATFLSTHTVSEFKVLPTYHPAAVAHQYSLRPTVVMDLLKAERQSHFPDLRRPAREIWIEPTLEDMEEFYDQYIREASILSVDIETSGTRITCVGFAPSDARALVIPFDDARRKSRSYWPTLSDERAAWAYIKRILSLPLPHKLFQNGLYDISFLWRAYGIKVMGAAEDTMLLSHALQPESLKGLGYLGSVFTDERAWKEMRGGTSTVKLDE